MLLIWQIIFLWNNMANNVCLRYFSREKTWIYKSQITSGVYLRQKWHGKLAHVHQNDCIEPIVTCTFHLNCSMCLNFHRLKIRKETLIHDIVIRMLHFATLYVHHRSPRLFRGDHSPDIFYTTYRDRWCIIFSKSDNLKHFLNYISRQLIHYLFEIQIIRNVASEIPLEGGNLHLNTVVEEVALISRNPQEKICYAWGVTIFWAP